VRVVTPGNGAAPLALLNIKAPKNGYCLVYVSNESPENVFFDDLQVRHDRGRILEENHYYAFGLKIAPLSSKAFAAPQNNYQYQGDYSEFDDDLGWNDFELRSYDPQIGRFLQHDPYDEIASGYIGMGDDPANLTDPNGGCTSCLAGVSSTLQGMFGTLTPVTVFGKVKTPISTISTISNFSSLAINGFQFLNYSIGIGQSAKNVSSLSNNIFSGKSTSGNDDWMPFKKSDLTTYVESKGILPTENNLGTEFENIFEKYIFEEAGKGAIIGRFRRVRQPWTGGDVRNSEPDFESDDINTSTGQRYNGTQAYEVKQNSGRGIYLSSNEYQIKAHISNHSARNQGNLANGIKPGFTLITTYDVKFSSGISRHANGKNMTYTHVRSEYKIVNGGYKFRFKSAGIFEQVIEFFKELF
jgi:RHS repeat-associated protein